MSRSRAVELCKRRLERTECRVSTPEALVLDRDDPDAIEDLGDQIATLFAQVHAATHRLLVLIAEFDRRGGWKPGGFQSCAHWLRFRTGIDLGAARERVRAAHALDRFPAVSASMARGELSFAKVRAITRLPELDADREQALLDFARKATASEVERRVRSWKILNRGDEQEVERIRHASRCLSIFPDEDGMYLIRGRLDPEVGALLMRAIDAASDVLYAGETRAARSDTPRDAALAAIGAKREETDPRQRRADAIGLLAERAMSNGFGGASAELSLDEAPADETRTTRPSADVPSADEAPNDLPQPSVESGSSAERYQVVLHVEPDTLGADTEAGRSDLEDGTRVSAETSRRLACDASVVRIVHRLDGSILDVGRKTRTIPPALRRALETRDRGGCRFPGCGVRFCDAHHIRHWADGGATRLDNLILLCRRHHRALHEEGFSVDFGPTGRANFYDRRGRPLPDAPPPLPIMEWPVETLISDNQARGVEPRAYTSSARWSSERETPWEAEARVRGALDPPI